MTKEERRQQWAAKWPDPELALRVRDSIADELEAEAAAWEYGHEHGMQLRAQAERIRNWPPVTPR